MNQFYCISDLPSLPTTPGISRFWFVYPGLPVNKSKSPGYHKLVKSPGFFTFISRFFRYSLAFLHFSYFFVSKNPNWVTYYPLSVLNRAFVYIWSKISTVKSFSKWRRKIHTKIHRTCMKKFLQTKICLYSSPLCISGQWSNGSASQCFAFGSNLPVLTPSFRWNPKSISRFWKILVGRSVNGLNIFYSKKARVPIILFL